MLEHRQRRPRPGLDAKVLTEWNAMAVAALAYAGRALDRPCLGGRRRRDGGGPAQRAPPGRRALAEFLAPRHGRTEAPGLLGRLRLARRGFHSLERGHGRGHWITEARAAADALIELFWDHAGGGFFTTGNDGEQLIARMKDVYDGAVPSANATAALALARLGELTGAARYEEVARGTVRATGPALAVSPAAFAATAVAADYLSGPRRQVVVSSKGTALVRPVWARYGPSTVLAWGEPYQSPLWEGRDDAAAAGLVFVCEGYRCQLPVRDADEVAALLVPPLPSTYRAG